MYKEVRKNSQIFQDSNNTYFPEDETQISSVVKELFKKNQPTEVIGMGSKSFIGNKIQSAKNYPFQNCLELLNIYLKNFT